MEKERNGSWSKATTSSVKHGGDSVMAWICVAANGTGSLVLINDVTTDRSSRRNSEVYRATLSSQIQPNAAELIGWCLIIQMNNDYSHTVKAAQSF